MALVPVPRTKWTFHGTTPAGDQWNTSFHSGSIGALSQSAKSALAAAVLAEWTGGFWATSGDLWSTATSISSIIAHTYNADGALVNTTEYGDPQAGTSTAHPLPDEVSVVASLRTATAGRSGRGRMYLPAPAVTTVGTLGEFDGTDRDAVSGDFAAMLSAINDDLTAAGIVVGVSVLSAVLGGLLPVTEVAVGNIFDAQRRRRNAYTESYATNAVTP